MDIKAILIEKLYVTDAWGGSKLASWKYGSDVMVSGIDEAVEEIIAGITAMAESADSGIEAAQLDAELRARCEQDAPLEHDDLDAGKWK